MSLPDTHAVLEASHLEVLETEALEAADTSGDSAPGPTSWRNLVPQTVMEAEDRLRRVAYWRRRIAEINEQEATMVAPLMEQIERIRSWAEKQRQRPERCIALHEAALIEYYRAHPPSKGKTLKLPSGKISSRDPGPEWRYNDEVLTQWLLAHNPDLVRTRVEPDKQKLRKAVTVQDGRAFLTETGEIVEGMEVVDRPVTFNVEVGA